MESWPGLLVVIVVLVLPGVGGSPGEAAAAIRPGLGLLPEELPGEEATAARPAEAEAAAQPLHRAVVVARQSREEVADPPRRSREEAAAEVGPTCYCNVLCCVLIFWHR